MSAAGASGFGQAGGYFRQTAQKAGKTKATGCIQAVALHGFVCRG